MGSQNDNNYLRASNLQIFMAKLADYSYSYTQNFKIGKKIFREKLYKDWYYFQPNNVSENVKCSAFCAVNDITKEIVIVFKGSEPSPFDIAKFISDWCISDMRMLMGRVPLNFLDFANYTQEVKNNFKEYKYYMTGHSLGGTIAQLISILDCNKDIETYTFNAFGAKPLLKNIENQDFLINKSTDNIKNFIVNMDLVAGHNQHIGSVCVIEYKKNLAKSFVSIILESPKLFANLPYKIKNSVISYFKFLNLFVKKTDAHLMNNFRNGFEYENSKDTDNNNYQSTRT